MSLRALHSMCEEHRPLLLARCPDELMLPHVLDFNARSEQVRLVWLHRRLLHAARRHPHRADPSPRGRRTLHYSPPRIARPPPPTTPLTASHAVVPLMLEQHLPLHAEGDGDGVAAAGEAAEGVAARQSSAASGRGLFASMAARRVGRRHRRPQGGVNRHSQGLGAPCAMGCGPSSRAALLSGSHEVVERRRALGISFSGSRALGIKQTLRAGRKQSRSRRDLCAK